MDSNPKVSIIIPVYNVEQFLAKTLRSVLDQSYTNLEVICINDGSTDRSALILELFAASDNRIVVINQQNNGVSSARNAGLDGAQGDIVWFVDSDDILDRNACEILVEAFLSETNVDAVVFGARALYTGLEPNEWLESVISSRDVIYEGFKPDVLFKENLTPFIWREAFSRDLLEKGSKLRFNEEIGLGEDLIFQFEAFPKAKKIVFIENRIYGYRSLREGSLMSNAAKDVLKRLIKHVGLVDLVCSHWADSGYMEHYRSDLFKWTIDFITCDVLSQPAETQHIVCPMITKLWSRWFPPDIAQSAGLSSYEMTRYNWVIADLSLQERAAIPDLLKAEDRKAAFSGFKGLIRRCLTSSAALALKRGLRRVLPMPARRFDVYVGDLNARIDRINDLLLDNSSMELAIMALDEIEKLRSSCSKL